MTARDDEVTIHRIGSANPAAFRFSELSCAQFPNVTMYSYSWYRYSDTGPYPGPSCPTGQVRYDPQEVRKQKSKGGDQVTGLCGGALGDCL